EITRIANDLIDAVIGKGEMDLVEDYSYPLPITVISRMLGIADEDRQLLVDTTVAIVNGFDVNATGEKRDHANRVCQAFTEMVTRYVDARRAEPQDDLLTVLVQAEEAGDRMSRDELVSMVFTIAGAGHETTANVLSTLVNTLLRDRTLWERLLADRSLVPAAVEEGLRTQPPIRIRDGRWCDRDVELDGVKIAAGEPVSVWLGAANRDETVFEDPDTFRLDRKSNRHLAFSTGPYVCVGAGLARLELRVALNALLTRLPDLELANAEEKWGSLVSFRGLVTLPVKWKVN
ncbi:MAG: cytochrome P450, partial [Caulobacter sp.]